MEIVSGGLLIAGKVYLWMGGGWLWKTARRRGAIDIYLGRFNISIWS